MKNLRKVTSALIIAIVMIASTVKAEAQSGLQEVKIKTSATCSMCKETIEKNLAFEKGIKKSVLDVDTKIVTVTYNPEKTSPEKIRLAISKIGYDADDVKADPKGFNKLDDCCKKGKVCPDKK